MSLSRKVLRQRERESVERSRAIRNLAAEMALVESGVPIDGVPDQAARDRLLTLMNADLFALVRSELRSRPDQFVQGIDGRWFLIENKADA
jgi:hypothetical protein